MTAFIRLRHRLDFTVLDVQLHSPWRSLQHSRSLGGFRSTTFVLYYSVKELDRLLILDLLDLCFVVVAASGTRAIDHSCPSSCLVLLPPFSSTSFTWSPLATFLFPDLSAPSILWSPLPLWFPLYFAMLQYNTIRLIETSNKRARQKIIHFCTCQSS